MKFTENEIITLDTLLTATYRAHAELFELLKERKDCPFKTSEKIILDMTFDTLSALSTMLFEALYNN